ncbi:dienelactone hydrolase family protein [Sandarakinorhabdus sp.]|uniref:alpha/beta hydrolase family protein n=1 Tax=Sandarakinorhabdus sp. TaxID=1916663 RepID=UPI00286EA9C1|nr:prolyl oligopeptidase family serine peptidase [Sandarakinorhabdus sp.]
MKDLPGPADTLRAALIERVGGVAATRFTAPARAGIATTLDGVRVEWLELDTGSQIPVRALLTGPLGEWHHQPAVLYCHAHGNRYDIGASELAVGRPALLTPPYAKALADRGIVALCIDLPCFGDRAHETEQEAAKRQLWYGHTLFGTMLNDLAGALDLLSQFDGVDSTRIGAFGISMGATLAFWLAALDPRLKAVAHVCCFADLETLVATGAHDLHGIYMIVPDLLDVARTGQIAGLVAPRPQLACMGLTDPLTPPDAVERAVADVRSAYDVYGAATNLHIHISPDTGHSETPAMRTAVLEFFDQHL